MSMFDVDAPAFMRLCIAEWHASVVEIKKQREEERLNTSLELEDNMNKRTTMRKMTGAMGALASVAGSEMLLGLIIHAWHTYVVAERGRKKYTDRMSVFLRHTTDGALMQLTFFAWKD